MGAVIGSGGGTHYDLLKDLNPYLSDSGALLALLLVLLGLVIAGPCSPVMKHLDAVITIGNQTGYTVNASTPWSSVKSQSFSLPSLK